MPVSDHDDFSVPNEGLAERLEPTQSNRRRNRLRGKSVKIPGWLQLSTYRSWGVIRRLWAMEHPGQMAVACF